MSVPDGLFLFSKNFLFCSNFGQQKGFFGRVNKKSNRIKISANLVLSQLPFVSFFLFKMQSILNRSTLASDVHSNEKGVFFCFSLIYMHT